MDYLRRGLIMSGVGQILLGCGGSDTAVNGLGAEIAANSVISRTGGLDSLDSTRLICTYYDQPLATVRAVVVTVSFDGSLTFGTPVTIPGATGSIESSVRALSSGMALALYGNASGRAETVVLSITGSSVTVNSAVSVSSMLYDGYAAVARLSATSAAVVYTELSSPFYAYARVVSVSGTTPSVGTEVGMGAYYRFPQLGPIDSTNVLLTARDISGFLSALVLSVSGTTPSFGAPTASTTSIQPDDVGTSTDGLNAAVAFTLASTSYVRPISISGVTVSFGAALQLNASTDRGITVLSSVGGNLFMTSSNSYSVSSSKLEMVEAKSAVAAIAGPISDNAVTMVLPRIKFSAPSLGVIIYTNASQYLCARSVRL